MTKPQPDNRPTVRVQPHSYQPSKAELEEPIRIPTGTTAKQLAVAAVTPGNIIESHDT